MTTQKSELAKAFSVIAEQGEKLENTSAILMKLVKEDKIENLDMFNTWVASAFDENGWSTAMGRPLPGAFGVPAPMAVKQYVSIFRAAYKLELPVLTYESLRALRDATDAKKKANAAPSNVIKDPELKGVLVKAGNRMNGALWHDAIVVIEHLNDDDRDEFENRLRKLVMRFTSKVPKEIRKAA